MTPRRRFVSRLLLATTLALPLAAHARPDGPDGCEPMPPPPHHGPYGEGLDGPMLHMGPPFLHGLDLSESQEDQVFDILHKQAPLLREKAKALRKARETLREARAPERYDDGKVRQLTEAAAKTQGELDYLRISTDQRLYALLTDEQKKRLEERKREGERHERCAGPPQAALTLPWGGGRAATGGLSESDPAEGRSGPLPPPPQGAPR